MPYINFCHSCSSRIRADVPTIRSIFSMQHRVCLIKIYRLNLHSDRNWIIQHCFNHLILHRNMNVDSSSYEESKCIELSLINTFIINHSSHSFMWRNQLFFSDFFLIILKKHLLKISFMLYVF